MSLELAWLLEEPNWREGISALDELASEEAWTRLIKASRTRLDFIATQALFKSARRRFEGSSPTPDVVRVAILSSCTVDHLVPAICVGGMRRALWIDVYTTPFAQFRSELRDPSSGLAKFKPEAVLFVLDARQVTSRLSAAMSAEEASEQLEYLVNEWTEDWDLARTLFNCEIIQQAILPIPLPVLGNNEHRLPGAPLAFIRSANRRLRAALDEFGGNILAADEWCARDGVCAWHEPSLWYHAKQEIKPRAAPAFGDQLARVLAALRGRASKCLVLDLDNTLWGGVIGDDGPQGIILGQGSALGEAYASFQNYVRSLAERGVILAVCSKNEERIALDNFKSHPEMVLKLADIACFVANWNDKASNLREIASRLNIGLDAIVFADDNPFERNLVRRELPAVVVPELPDDPALFGEMIASAGYFEGISLTEEDRSRSQQYQSKIARETARLEATDLGEYLKSLEMVGNWSTFQATDLPRITQLTNKTNQFNLTTRRYSTEAILETMRDPGSLTLQMRLTDIYGDSGIIALIIGRVDRTARQLSIDSWLMSCRVLGRSVEQAMLNLLVEAAKDMSVSYIVGEYIPTEKNGIVRNHYSSLGFLQSSNEENRWILPVEGFFQRNTYLRLEGAWT